MGAQPKKENTMLKNLSLKTSFASAIFGAVIMLYDNLYCGIIVPTPWVFIFPLITITASSVLYLLIHSDF